MATGAISISTMGRRFIGVTENMDFDVGGIKQPLMLGR